MKHLFTLLGIALAAAVQAASPAATQDWVRMFVATSQPQAVSYSISKDTGYMTATVTNEDGRVFVISHAMHDKLGLVVSNCTPTAVALGVTNGTLFALRSDHGVFTNALVGAAIASVGTNCLQFAGVDSHPTNGVDTIDGWFDVRGCRLDRPTAAALIGSGSTALNRDARPRWRRLLAKAAEALSGLLVPSARADTWGDYRAWIYQPLENRDTLGTFAYSITDAKTGESFSVGTDDEGRVDIDSLNFALDSLKLSTTSIVRDAVDAIVPRVNNIENAIADLDTELESLNEVLKESITDLSNRLKKIELQDSESGISKSLTRSETTKDTTIYVGENLFNVAGAQVDGASIVSNDNGKITLCGFPQLTAADAGKLPAFTRVNGGPGLLWFFLRDLLDGKSISAKANEDSSQKAISDGGIQLAGWDAPDAAPNKCEDTVAMHLTNKVADTSHYLLTRYGNDAKVHYMRIGNLKNLDGGSALRVYSEDDVKVTIGSGATTNTVRLAASPDSNLEFGISKSDDEIVVTVGVHWK